MPKGMGYGGENGMGKGGGRKATSAVGQPFTRTGYRQPFDGRNEMADRDHERLTKGRAGGTSKQRTQMPSSAGSVAKNEMDY